MKHFSLKNRFWSFLGAATFVLAGLQAHAQDCIYYVNWSLVNDGRPHVSNEASFIKLYETSKGSGVYHGVLPMSEYGMNYFRFYKELQDCDPSQVSWKKENIAPFSFSGYPLEQLGKSGVYFADNVKYIKMAGPNEEASTWELQGSGQYDTTVDLNNGTLTLIPVNTIFALINDTKTPDLSKLDNYTCLNALREYLPEGNYSINLYSPLKNNWIDLSEVSFNKGWNTLINDKSTYTSDPSGAVLSWSGGTVEGYQSENYGEVYLRADGPIRNSITSPQVYLVGDFCDWNLYDAIEFPASDPDGSLFNIIIPENVVYFKFTTDRNWDINLGTTGTIKRNTQGDFEIFLDQDGNNFEFDVPSVAPVNAVLDLKNYKITIDSSAPMHESGNYGTTSDCLYLNMPGKDYELFENAPQSVLSTYISIPKTGENEWKGECYIPTGEVKFNFISGLTPKGSDNIVIAPQAGIDRDIVFNDGYAFSSAVEVAQSDAGYWYCSSDIDGTAEITVTKEGDKYVLKIDAASVFQPSCIYLIGQPQGWDIYSDEMSLYLTDADYYVGNYYIPIGSSMFRFYTDLGDWNYGSVGSQYDDYPVQVSMQGAVYHTSGVFMGKGSWEITDWQGGTMYFYISKDFQDVVFSPEPLQGYGEVKDVERKFISEGLFLYQDGFLKYSWDKNDSNLYEDYFTDYYDKNKVNFSLKSHHLPISSQESEWNGSYAIVPVGDGIIDLWDGDFHVIDIERIEGIQTEPAKSFTINKGSSNYLTIDLGIDLNKNKLYVANMKGVYAIPSSLNELPSPFTAERFSQYYLGNGKIIDIPANGFDVWFYGFQTQNPNFPYTIDFNKSPLVVGVDADRNYGWGNYELVSPNWKGGKVYLGLYYACDMSQINKVKVNSSNDKEYYLEETQPGSLVYKGVWETNKTADGLNYLSFEIAKTVVAVDYGNGPIDQTYILEVGSPFRKDGGVGGMDPMLSDLSILVEKGEAHSKVDFFGFPLYLPNVAQGVFEITLDLNNMSLDLKQIEGVTGNLYEVFSQEGSDLDGVASYIDAQSGNSVVQTAYMPIAEEGYDFNLMNSGIVIYPANGQDTEISFNDYGIWTGAYEQKATVAVRSGEQTRSQLRAYADENAKWHLESTGNEKTQINIMIDESSKTITVYSSAHSEGWFITSNNTPKDELPNINNVASYSGDWMGHTGDGMYKGVFEKTTSDPINISFQKGLSEQSIYSWVRGLSADVYNYNGSIFDLSQNKDAQQAAFDTYNDGIANVPYPATSWILIGEPGEYGAEYDINSRSLKISYLNPLSIESISDDVTGNEIKVIPALKSVLISCNIPQNVNIYNVGGMLLKSVKVDGSIQVELPSGLYIIGGKKIIVR